MPILRKNGRRIYFAHIPKCAGTALYVWALENGWSVANLKVWDRDGSADLIRERFGIHQFQMEGDSSGLRASVQHAPADIWARWGPFDASFAIIRDPAERFTSAVHYHQRHSVEGPPIAANDIAGLVIERLSAGESWVLDGHFAPQGAFLADDTRTFRMSDPDLADQLGEFLDLPPAGFAEVNAAEEKAPLGPEIDAFVRDFYREDFARYRAA